MAKKLWLHFSCFSCTAEMGTVTPPNIVGENEAQIENVDETVEISEPRTRSGRIVKQPLRLGIS